MLFAADVTDWTTFDYVTLSLLMAVGLGWVWAVIFLIACTAFAVFVSFHEHQTRHTAAEAMRRRNDEGEPLTDSQLVSEFGDDVPQEVAERVMRALTRVAKESYTPEEVAFEPRRLRGDDDLIDGLGLGFDSLGLHMLFAELENELGERCGMEINRLIDQKLATGERLTITIGELMQLVAAKLKAANRTIEPGVDYSPRRQTFFARLAAFFGRHQPPK